MPNRRHNTRSGEPSGPKQSGAGPRTSVWPGREGTANWQGVPGKTQSKPRDASGTKKLRQSPREEGL